MKKKREGRKEGKERKRRKGKEKEQEKGKEKLFCFLVFWGNIIINKISSKFNSKINSKFNSKLLKIPVGIPSWNFKFQFQLSNFPRH